MFVIAPLGGLLLRRPDNEASSILNFVQMNIYIGLYCIALRSIELAMQTEHTQSDGTVVLLKSTIWSDRF